MCSTEVKKKLTVPDHQKTPTPDAEKEVINTDVSGMIKSVSRLKHRNEVVTPGVKSKALGYGIDAIEIHITITEASVKDTPPAKDFMLDGEAKGGNYTRQFDEEQQGKKAWYKARKRFKGKTRTFGPFCKAWSSLIS
jgi:hypothetical protein